MAEPSGMSACVLVEPCVLETPVEIRRGCPSSPSSGAPLSYGLRLPDICLHFAPACPEPWAWQLWASVPGKEWCKKKVSASGLLVLMSLKGRVSGTEHGEVGAGFAACASYSPTFRLLPHVSSGWLLTWLLRLFLKMTTPFQQYT